MSVLPLIGTAGALGDLRPGDPVNLEVDIIAKYVERLLGARA